MMARSVFAAGLDFVAKNAIAVAAVGGSVALSTVAYAQANSTAGQLEQTRTEVAAAAQSSADVGEELRPLIIVNAETAAAAAEDAATNAATAAANAEAAAANAADIALTSDDVRVVEAAAERAQSSADRASDAAVLADDAAEAAQAAADAAQEAVDVLPGDISTAQQTAEGAVSDAANAQSSADGAQSSADDAAQAAAAAQSSANAAQSSADAAQAAADAAQTTADGAQSSADGAQSSADAAQTTADDAVSDAADAQATADEALAAAQRVGAVGSSGFVGYNFLVAAIGQSATGSVTSSAGSVILEGDAFRLLADTTYRVDMSTTAANLNGPWTLNNVVDGSVIPPQLTETGTQGSPARRLYYIEVGADDIVVEMRAQGTGGTISISNPIVEISVVQ